MSPARRHAKAGVSIAALRIGNAVLALGISVLLTRQIGAEGFGTYAYALVLLALAALPVSNGWSMLLLRVSAVARGSRDWHETRGLGRRGLQYALVVSAAAALACALLAWQGWMPAAIGLVPALLLAGVLLCDQWSALRMALLRGLERPVLAQLPEMVVRPLLLLAALGAWALLWPGSLSVDRVFIALAAAAVGGLVAGLLILRSVAPAELRSAAPRFDDRRWFGAARALAANAGLFVLSGYTDILILGLLGSLADVGVYRVATQLAVFCALGYTSVNMVANQRFAAVHGSGRLDKLQHEATVMARLGFAGNLGLALVISALGHWLIPMAFGPQFSAAVVPLWILSAGQVINAAAGMPNALLNMTGNETVVTRIVGGCALAGAALCAMGVLWLGAIGAALAVLLTVTLTNAALWKAARDRLGVDASVLGLALQLPRS